MKGKIETFLAVQEDNFLRLGLSTKKGFEVKNELNA
jgi:hypothetical protein